MLARERVLSGMRPTGRLHLGNYHLMPVLDGIRERRAEFAARPARLREILQAGSARARRIAGQTLSEAKAAVGIT